MTVMTRLQNTQSAKMRLDRHRRRNVGLGCGYVPDRCHSGCFYRLISSPPSYQRLASR